MWVSKAEGEAWGAPGEAGRAESVLWISHKDPRRYNECETGSLFYRLDK